MIQVFDRLRFGPAGFPNSYNGPREDVAEYLRKIGLDAMELEFVRGIWLKPERAELFKKKAREHDVVYTAHGPYYINLNSPEEEKIRKSIDRIVGSAKALYYAGGFSLVFHAAYYMKNDPKKVTERMKIILRDIRKRLDDEGFDVWLRPELMGKQSQWGDIGELLEIASEIEGVEPAIDFAHLHARYVGGYNTEEEWRKVLEAYENALGTESLKRMHIHISGIEYTKKGEKRHVNLNQSDLNYQDLLRVLKEFDVRGVIISESPNLEEDALLMKKIYEKL